MQQQKIKASFFFTGTFYYNSKNDKLIKQLAKNGNFLGNHSYAHLLYSDWNKRDSLLVDKSEFINDLFGSMERLGHISDNAGDPPSLRKSQYYFLPPYEWYNDSISSWCNEFGRQLINFTAGTGSNADYTWPELPNYKSSATIYHSILEYERTKPAGLNGFMLLMHVGTDPRRRDKFYFKLPQLLKFLRSEGYQFQTVATLLQQ